jgi:hypothetical protein
LKTDNAAMSLPPPELPPFARTLEYAAPVERRPGILTAVAVMSIVIAALGVIMNCSGIFQAYAFSQLGPRITMAPAAPTPAPALINPNALSPDKHQIVLITMTEIASLTPTRVKMLDLLLTQAGTELFPFDQSQITPQSVRGVISESGRARGDEGQSAKDYFVLSTGRIELSDDSAVFHQTRGESFSVSLRSTHHSTMIISPTTTPATLPVIPLLAGMARFAIWTGLDAAVGLLTAVLLLIAGIMVLRDSPRGRRWHIVWAWIKLPLAVAGGIVYWLQMSAMMSSISAGNPLGNYIWALSAAVQAAIFCAYPLGVLIVMHTRGVMAFYGAELK